MSSLMKRGSNGQYPRLGDAFLNAKNNSGTGNRGFVLLGDPSMRLAYPEKNVVLTGINGHATPRTKTKTDSVAVIDPNTGDTNYITRTTITTINDTLSGLQQVSFTGEIRGFDNTLESNFTGTLNTTVYDVPSKITTTDASTPNASSYLTRKNILYNGIVSVTGGKFHITFMVPKDITYIFGNGKIAFYAANTAKTEDANGNYQNIQIGGSNPNAPFDSTAPLIKLYMNDTTFRDGGLTDSNPYFLALLSDENGINVSTTGLGHEMSAVLDGDAANELVLNPYYTSDQNDYRKGSVYYHLLNLSDGPHNISFKAWDNYNNSNTASLNFLVASSASLALEQLFNYPNPFSGSTGFHISHNFAGQPLTVSLEIFNDIGQRINELTANFESAPAAIGKESFTWDGTDEAGNALRSGVYLYRVTLQTTNGQKAQLAKQLVFIR